MPLRPLAVAALIALTPAALVLADGRAEPVQARGDLDAVTVYRGQALVTRAVHIPMGGQPPAQVGTVREVLVTDLPEAVVPESVFAEPGPGAEIRSVRYRVRPVLRDTRDEVRAIDERIRALDDSMQANQRRADTVKFQQAFLNRLDQFVPPAANAELTHGVLRASTISQLTEFLYQHRKALLEDELALAGEGRSLADQRALAQRERDQIAGNSATTVREAVVLVHFGPAAPNQETSFKLRYLVNNATWSPSYNVRADDARTKVGVEYYAAIEQMSGEDWDGVSMTLSTATPSLVSRAPTLTAMTIGLGTLQAEAPQVGYAMAKELLSRQQRELGETRNRKVPQAQTASGQRGGGDDLDKSLNTLADQMQLLDLVTRDRVIRSAEGAAQQDSEGLSVTYDLSSRTSLPSRSDRQLVQIASLPLPGEFYKIAVPALTTYVYNEASVVNSSKLVLLSGPVSTYVGGQFVGVGEVPTISVGERFTVGFGIDSSLRASRELVERSDSVQGGNRVVDTTYRLAIENFGSAPADIRLMDRLPQTRESEIKLTMLDPGAKPFEDPEASQSRKKNGIVRWDVKVGPQLTGAGAFGLEYRFRLEHDKQMMVVGMAGR